MPTRPEDYQLPKDVPALIRRLEARYQSGEAARSDLQAKLNLAFMLGHQWVWWDAADNRLRKVRPTETDPNAPVRITINKIGGIVERTIAKLTKTNPVPVARPVSNEPSDVDAARVATRILAHEFERMRILTLLPDLYFWVIPVGYAYLYVGWNAEEGSPVALTEDGQPIPAGEVQVTIVPHFELVVDPNARTMSEARWCIHTVSMTREAVYERYGIIPEDPQPAQTLEDEIRRLTHDRSYQSSTDRETEKILVHRFWLRPGGRANPEGMVFTWAGKTALEGPEPFPFEHGVLPYVQFNCLPGLGSREGRTWVTDLIGPQIDYNDSRSREATIRRILTPKILYPRGSMDPNMVTSRVELIDYDPVAERPTLLLPDARWVQQFMAAMDRTDREMNERAGQSEVSKGQLPASGLAAAAILALQEADDTKLAITAKELAASMAEVGWQVLNLVKQYWDEPRLVRTWSESTGELAVERFSASDLRGNYDVHVTSESALPRSMSARIQLAFELRKAGYLQDARQFFRMIDLPGVDLIHEEVNAVSKQAERENERLRRGIKVRVEQWHNHYQHIAVHNEFRLTEEYERLPDEVRAVVDAHVAVHEMLVSGQLGVPTPPGTPVAKGRAAPGIEDLSPEQTSPVTGLPPNPTNVAAGLEPPLVGGPQESKLAAIAGIGGPGEPGYVPGVPVDELARQIGR